MDGLLVVYVEAGLEGEGRNDGRRYVNESHRWVLCVEVAAAAVAPLAITINRFIVSARVFIKSSDVIRAFGDLYAVRLPQGKGADRPC